MWPENAEAHEQIVETQRLYGIAAIERGDLELADNVLDAVSAHHSSARPAAPRRVRSAGLMMRQLLALKNLRIAQLLRVSVHGMYCKTIVHY